MQVGNERKQKSLHALGLVPAKDMDLAKLHETPDGTTPCPYVTLAERRTRKADETLGEPSSSWCSWDLSACCRMRME